jgi:hypothetical protein
VRASAAGNGETGDRRWSPVPPGLPDDVTHRPAQFQFRDVLRVTKPDRFARRAVRCTKIMAREANPLKTEPITVSLNLRTIRYRDSQLELGVYCNNRTEAVRLFIYDHCNPWIA